MDLPPISPGGAKFESLVPNPLVVLTNALPAAFLALVFLLVVLTNALSRTFFAKVSVVCFPMRTTLALSLLLFGGRL